VISSICSMFKFTLKVIDLFVYLIQFGDFKLDHWQLFGIMSED
jgi:hypothetical protein